MNAFVKYLGVIVLLLGVVCLVVYQFVMQQNWLLLLAMALELVGLVAFVLLNKKA